MEKKFFLLALASLLFPLFVSGSTYYYAEIGGIYYRLDKTSKTARVVSEKQGIYVACEHKECIYSGDVVIPETVDDEGITYTVTEIGGVTSDNSGNGAFEYCKDLTSITIPRTVKQIGIRAFEGCTSLQAVYISDLSAWCKVDCGLFYWKEVLVDPSTFYEVSKRFFSFESNPLYHAHNLYLNGELIKELIIPEDVERVGTAAFAGGNFSSVTFHENVWFIGSGAFFYCNELKDVYTYSSRLLTEGDPFQEVNGSFTDTKNKTLHLLEKYKDNYFTNKEFYTYDGGEVCRQWSDFGRIEYIPENNVVQTYKLTYMVDGEVYETFDVNEGESITPENEPTKEGYTFSGWSEVPSTMPDHDVTVTGTFTINKYTLTYIVDGEVYKSFDVEYGSTITPEQDPSKDNYEFSGWSGIPHTMPANDVVVTGSFTYVAPSVYTVTYLVDGDVYVTTDYNEGESIVPESEPQKEGYTFSGWSWIPSKMPGENVVISGSFTVNKYRLTYILDGEEYKTGELEYGTSITPEAEPEREGYVFSGWSYIPGTMPANDVTITGTFAKGIYTLTYILNGKTYKTCLYSFGDKVTPEQVSEEEGYTFSGWSYIPSNMPAENVTVTGTYTVNTYKLIYMVDGEVYKTVEVEYGAKLTAEEEPEKDGYTFSGWSWMPSKMPAEDVVVTGTFKQIGYSIDDYIYVINGNNATCAKGSPDDGELIVSPVIVIENNTYNVTSIGDYAFSYNSGITSVTIPDGVTSIGNSAFEGCSSVMSLTLGKDIESIGSRAFAGIARSASVRKRASGSPLVVECHAESLPDASLNSFEDTPIESAVLMVKDDLVYMYKAIAPWYRFGTIIGFDEATGISSVYNNGKADIFSIDGRKIDSPKKGINIIRTDGRTRKVTVK